MSYKHNNLMAMRTNYWNDTQNPDVLIVKEFLQITLSEQNIYAEPSLADAKYLFFRRFLFLRVRPLYVFLTR